MANSTTLYTLPDGRRAVDVTENKTLAAVDGGVVQVVKTDAITVTLPSTADGLSFTVMNGGDAASGTPVGAGADGSCAVNLSPAAADLITGVLATPVDNKDLINTKATSKVGDEVTVIGGDANGWNITSIKGVWSREA
jgi:hypothetical protein